MDLTTIKQWVDATGPLLLIMAVWALATGRVVPRMYYDAKCKEAEKWQDIAWRNQGVAGRTVDLADRALAGTQETSRERSAD